MIRLSITTGLLRVEFTRGEALPDDEDLSDMQANIDRIGEENMDAIAVDYAVNKGKPA